MEPENQDQNQDTTERDISVPVLKMRKEHLERRLNALSFTWWGWSLSSLIFAVLFVSIDLMTHNKEFVNLQSMIYYLLPRIMIGIIAGAFMYGYALLLFRITITNRLRRIEYDLIKYGSEELQENIEENFFTKLVQINFKYIDQYYLQTQEQAEKSFRLSQFASIVGLIIVIAGILMMFFAKTEPAYVTTGAGVLSEFIAAIFFYLYNKTILKMSQYHQKLVITQNISLALKITDDMEKVEKTKALEKIIDRITLDVNKYLTSAKD